MITTDLFSEKAIVEINKLQKRKASQRFRTNSTLTCVCLQNVTDSLLLPTSYISCSEHMSIGSGKNSIHNDFLPCSQAQNVKTRYKV